MDVGSTTPARRSSRRLSRRSRIRRLGGSHAAGAHHRGVRRDDAINGRACRAAEGDLRPPRPLREDGGRLLAHAEARRPDPCPVAGVGPLRPHVALELLAEGEAADSPAREVVAHVDHVGGPLLDAEHRVERRHAVGLGRRDGEALAHVVQPSAADPADARLERVQGRQQEVPLLARLATGADDAEIGCAPLGGAHPAGLRRSEQPVDRSTLGLRGGGVHQMKVHVTSIAITRDPRRRERRRSTRASPPAPPWP